jgi:hypothetical protein
VGFFVLVAEERVVVEEVIPTDPLEPDRTLFRALAAALTLLVDMLRVVNAYEEDVKLENSKSV